MADSRASGAGWTKVLTRLAVSMFLSSISGESHQVETRIPYEWREKVVLRSVSFPKNERQPRFGWSLISIRASAVPAANVCSKQY